jgi:hypothetical protein
MDEHLIPIDTRAILKMLEAQRQTNDALYDIVSLMYEKQRNRDEEYEKKPVKLTVNR